MPQNSEGPQQNQPPQNPESQPNTQPQRPQIESQSPTPERQSPLQGLLSRREFALKAAATITVLAGGPMLTEFVRAQGALDSEKKAYEDGKKPPEVFLAENKELLSNISLGTTFIPEDFRENKALGIKGLQWLRNDLGMTNLRIAIRQDTVPDITNPEPNLSYYKDFFAEMKRLGFNLTLCIGAKTPVYPESHIDAKTKNADEELKQDKKVITVDPSSKAGILLLDETKRLAAAFAHQFPDMMGLVDTIQPSNEPFVVDGKPQLDISPSYLREEISALAEVFPGKSILLNHFGVPDLHHLGAGTQLTRATNFAVELRKAGLPVTLAYDYYQRNDFKTETEGIVPDSIAITEAVALRGNEVFTWSGNVCETNGITRTAGEVAWEHWGDQYQPEVDVHQFQGQLLRVARTVINPSKPSRLMLFGSTSQIQDRFVVNDDKTISERLLLPSQEAMYQQIAAINNLQAS